MVAGDGAQGAALSFRGGVARRRQVVMMMGRRRRFREAASVPLPARVVEHATRVLYDQLHRMLGFDHQDRYDVLLAYPFIRGGSVSPLASGSRRELWPSVPHYPKTRPLPSR